MWQTLFNAPWPDERNILAAPIQKQAAQRIYSYWRSRGWQLILGEIILGASAIQYHVEHAGAYITLSGLIGIAYLLGFIPALNILWLVGYVVFFMVQGMIISGLGAATAVSFILPYTFAGMLVSGRTRLFVQAWCVLAFWISLTYEVQPIFVQLTPPRYILVSYNILLGAFTFQSLRFLNQLAVEINSAYVAEQVRQQSQQFLARVSHELRTPLNSVLGFAKLLKLAQLNDTQKGYLYQVIDEGEQLNRLVSDLLDSAHLSTGKLNLNWEVCDINALCETVVEEQRPNIKSPVKLTLNLLPTLPPINGDPVRLRQIISNLVSNAIKHTETGEIAIHTWQDGRSILIDVQDTGAGIPLEQQGLIFVPFVQLDTRSAGVGLGLDIARQLAHLHEGDIDVKSEPGRGSTFTVRLPIKRSGEQ